MAMTMQKGGRRKTKEEKREADNVPTPYPLVEAMCKWAINAQDWGGGINVFDPCAGDGRILECFARQFQGICHATNYELRHDCDLSKVYGVYHKSVDFFSMRLVAKPIYDLAIMNPPYSDTQPRKFVKELLDCWIRPGGSVVTIMPAYNLDNADKIKGWLAEHIYRIAFLPKHSFPGKVLHLYLVEFRHQGSGFVDSIFIEREKKRRS